MIGFGLASPHAPHAFLPADRWDEVFYSIPATQARRLPKAVDQETREVIESYVHRIENAFGLLRQKLADYQPEVVIVVGGDQNEQFDRSLKPGFMVYTGTADLPGFINPLGVPRTPDMLRQYRNEPEVAGLLLQGLLDRGFDVNHSAELQTLTPNREGLPHAFTRSTTRLLTDQSTPLVFFYENTYDMPAPTAKRCYAIGRAIAEICRDIPKRIAIYGSGGLSHDPNGPRHGWIDEPLDMWILDRLAEGSGSALEAMYFPSMTMAGGTGETRAWITVAGATEEMGSPGATVVDYIPAHKSLTGLAFAYWDV